MVCEVEEMIIDSEGNRDTPVVIRWIDDHWTICHAKSYQNAFRSDVNRFETREDAVWFAEQHDCEVLHHEYDQLQEHICL